MKLDPLARARRIAMNSVFGWTRLAATIAMAMTLAAPARHAEAADPPFDKKSCTNKGRKLYGKIQIVTSFPDVKVQEVMAFPDVKVEKVKAFPNQCGQWQIVNAFPDTKVQIVTSFPDVKVQYVTAFPGVP